MFHVGQKELCFDDVFKSESCFLKNPSDISEHNFGLDFRIVRSHHITIFIQSKLACDKEQICTGQRHQNSMTERAHWHGRTFGL